MFVAGLYNAKVIHNVSETLTCRLNRKAAQSTRVAARQHAEMHGKEDPSVTAGVDNGVPDTARRCGASPCAANRSDRGNHADSVWPRRHRRP